MNVRPIRPILGNLSKALIALSLAAWIFTGSSAFARGGGGGHGGGGGGHAGGGFGGGHMGGGHMGGGHMGVGHHGFGFFPGFFLGGYGLGYGLGYGGYGYDYPYYGGYGYGYPYYDGYGNGYSNYYYPYTYGYTYPTTTYTPSYVYPVQNASSPGVTGVQYTVPVTVSSGTQGKMLGIDEEPVVDAIGHGMRVDRVYPGSAAERAGLQVGDVIHSANGYLTQIHGNLTWIINYHASNGVLNLSVHRVSNNRDATVVAQLP